MESVGSDATAHMAEETKHAAIVVPKAMIAAYYINAGLAFVITVTYCFVLVDYQSALDSPVGLYDLPFIQVFVNATSRSPSPSLLQSR
jgi:amino acid transporter